MTVLNELIKEFDRVKSNDCNSLREMLFFDGVLAIIEARYLQKEKDQIIDSFLAGKRFSDGDRYAPNTSLDIANKWFDDTHTVPTLTTEEK